MNYFASAKFRSLISNQRNQRHFLPAKFITFKVNSPINQAVQKLQKVSSKCFTILGHHFMDFKIQNLAQAPRTVFPHSCLSVGKMTHQFWQKLIFTTNNTFERFCVALQLIQFHHQLSNGSPNCSAKTTFKLPETGESKIIVTSQKIVL